MKIKKNQLQLQVFQSHCHVINYMLYKKGRKYEERTRKLLLIYRGTKLNIMYITPLFFFYFHNSFPMIIRLAFYFIENIASIYMLQSNIKRSGNFVTSQRSIKNNMDIPHLLNMSESKEIASKIMKKKMMKAFIIEPILLCCLYSVSFNFLLLKTQKIFQISYYDLKNYLFYLIEYGVISYNGQIQAYKIEKDGLDLLNIIKKETTQRKVNIKDITITFEYASLG